MAAPAFVQAASSVAHGATSGSQAYSSANTAGNLLVVVVNNNATANISMSDSQGNTYTQIGSQITGGVQVMSCYYAPNCKGGANTVSFTTSASGNIQMGVLEYSGAATANTLDQFASNSGSTGTSASAGPTASTTNATEIALAAFANGAGGFGMPTGYTTRCSPNSYFLVGEMTTASTGTLTATASQNSGPFDAFVMSFLPYVPRATLTGVSSLTGVASLTM